MSFKRYLPKRLLGRAMLILIAPTLALQVVVAWLFIERHWDGVTRQMTEGVANDIRLLSILAEADDEREALASAARALDYEAGFAEGETLAPEIVRPRYQVSARALTETLQERIDEPLAVDAAAYRKQVDIRVQLKTGVLRVLAPKRRMIASKPHFFLVWTAAASLILFGVAAVFLRNQVRPIRHLAKAADAYGRGAPVDRLPRGGALEVRQAAAAFRQMRARIDRHMEQRTTMLSAVGHDLRTPLTRMALELELAEPSEEVENLKRDVSEMRRMIDEYLAFARGEADEAGEPGDLSALAREVAEDSARGGEMVELIAPEQPVMLSMRSDAIRRCLSNLIGNAAEHGAHVRLTVVGEPECALAIVEDDGPGIPADQREEALKPFSRLDPARNQDRGGGVGLGLAIALDIARSHGGTLVLGDSALGGLKVTVSLPR